MPEFKSCPGMEDPMISMEGVRTAMTSLSMGQSSTRKRKNNVVSLQKGESAKQSQVKR